VALGGRRKRRVMDILLTRQFVRKTGILV
jgi:hypothetical protein